MISQTAEYSLRAVLCLAASAGHPQTTHQIAQATKIPPGYLCKVLQALSRAGLVHARRGLNGGFVLQRDAATLSILEVVRVADPCRRITTCPLHIHGTTLCALHQLLDHAATLPEKFLADITVAKLLATTCVLPPHAERASESCTLENRLCTLAENSPGRA